MGVQSSMRKSTLMVGTPQQARMTESCLFRTVMLTTEPADIEARQNKACGGRLLAELVMHRARATAPGSCMQLITALNDMQERKGML